MLYSKYNKNCTNITAIKKDWDVQKLKLKQKFAKLTNNDLLFNESNQEEMISRLQVKLGLSEEELLIIISKL